LPIPINYLFARVSNIRREVVLPGAFEKCIGYIERERYTNSTTSVRTACTTCSIPVGESSTSAAVGHEARPGRAVRASGEPVASGREVNGGAARCFSDNVEVGMVGVNVPPPVRERTA